MNLLDVLLALGYGRLAVHIPSPLLLTSVEDLRRILAALEAE